MRQKFQRSLEIGWSPRKRVRKEGQVSEAKQKAGTWDIVRYHGSNSRVDCDGLDRWLDVCLDVIANLPRTNTLQMSHSV